VEIRHFQGVAEPVVAVALGFVPAAGGAAAGRDSDDPEG